MKLIEHYVSEATKVMDAASGDRVLTRSQYREVLEDIVADAKSRLAALDDDDARDEEG